MQVLVFTGDITRSVKMSETELEATLADIERAISEIALWSGALPAFTRRGRDGWQGALSETRHALRAACYMRALVRRRGAQRDTVIALAEGEDSLPATGDLHGSLGPVFQDSTRLLQDLGRDRMMAHTARGAKDAALALIDYITRRWTVAQAAAIAEMLPPDGPTRGAAAGRLGKSRQALDQSLSGAGFRAIETAILAWEAEATT